MSRFNFEANSIWCKNGRLLFTIDSTIGADGNFCALYPPKTRITISFVDKDERELIKDEATVICGSRVNILKKLKEKYITKFGKETKRFSFREKTHREWIAKEA